MPGDLLPVVHAGTFELRIIELETERLNQMQRGFSGRAQSRHIARIGRDFGFDEDNIHRVNSKHYVLNLNSNADLLIRALKDMGVLISKIFCKKPSTAPAHA